MASKRHENGKGVLIFIKKADGFRNTWHKGQLGYGFQPPLARIFHMTVRHGAGRMPDGSQETLPTMKKILVPCDFSDPAIQAFKFASEIASINNGEVFLLNIIEVPTLHNSTALAYEMDYLKEFKENAKKNFEKMKARWGGEAKAHLLVEHGSVVSIINKFVETKAIDLVVMGTHGAGGLREFVVGSNTEKIVRSSKVPVIAVKRASKIASIKDIIFPIHLICESRREIDDPGSCIQVIININRTILELIFLDKFTQLFPGINIPCEINRRVYMQDVQLRFKETLQRFHRGN